MEITERVVQVIVIGLLLLVVSLFLFLTLGLYFVATGLFAFAIAIILPRKLKTSTKTLTACLAALTCIAAAWPIGIIHARVVHFLGVDATVAIGYCPGPCRVAQQILHDRYGVHTIPIAGCVVIGPEVWYAGGFNEVMVPLVIRDRGNDISRAASDEAWAKYEKHRSPDVCITH